MNGKVALGVCLLIVRIGLGQGTGQPQANFTTIYQFAAGCVTGVLLLGQDNNFYGTTSNCGSAGIGMLYQLSTSGDFRIIHSFTGGADGFGPTGPLAMDSDGNIYGATKGNTTFRWAFTGTYTSFGFMPGTNGNSNSNPFGLIYAYDGNLYGTTQNGGPGNAGFLFRLTPGGAMSTVHVFTEGVPNLMIQGSDGQLYGVLAGVSNTFALVSVSLGGALTNIVNDSRLSQQPFTLGSDRNFYTVRNSDVVQITSSGKITTNTITTSSNSGDLTQFSPLISASDGTMYCGGNFNLYQITTQLTGKVIYQYPLNMPIRLTIKFLVQGPDALYGTDFNAVFKLGLGGPGGLAPPPSAAGSAVVDPVPDLVTPVSAASSPTGLVTDPNLLVSGGRSVVGVAADGVSRVLVRGTATGVLTLAILDENMNPVTQSGQYGMLAPATGGGPFAPTATVQPVMAGGQSTFFAVYKSPVDFVRSDPAYQASDQKSPSRVVNIQVSNNGTVLTTQKLVIVRPPVVLIHGITSAPQFWSSFSPLVTACYTSGFSVSADPRFYIQCADYSRTVLGVASIQPTYGLDVTKLLANNPLNQNTLGYAYNAGVVMPQMQNTITAYSQNSPQANGLPVASVQADIVAHSMGSLIARTMPYALTSGSKSYQQPANYALGYIHKLITLGGPHLGSPLSIVALDPRNTCSWALAARMGEYPLQSATVAGYSQPISGGAADLVGDGQGACLSQALGTLQGSGDKQIPVALIAGQMSPTQLAGLDNSAKTTGASLLSHLSACASDYALKNYNSAGWLTLNRTSAAYLSDAIVPVTSALNGMDYMSGACFVTQLQAPDPSQCKFTLAQFAVHGPGTVNEIGFTGPSLLDAATQVPLETINLLNASVNDPVFAILARHLAQVGGCR